MSNVTEGLALDALKAHPVKVFLASKNIALRGQLVGHDDETVVLQDDYGQTVIYKNQIISITGDNDHE